MCLHPLSVKTEDAFGVPVNRSVPCGCCVECLKDKQNSWKIRLTEEARDHLYVYFFTLTYNDHSVPYVYSDTGEKCLYPRKSDIQLWIKRHRIKFERYFKRDIDFKYFICAEYGPNTGRPHYHGVFFTDITETFIGSMFADWRELYGFTKFELLGKKKSRRRSLSCVSNYVAKYCCKIPQLKSDAELHIDELTALGIIPKAFYLMSKGIGAGYVKRMKRFHVPRISNPRERVSVICDRAFYHDGAFKYKLPRFFRDKLYRMRFPCDARVWNKKKMLYEYKIVWRYKSKNPLALQIQNEIRSRVLEDFGRRIEEKRLFCPHLSDDQVYLEVTRDEQTARLARSKDIFTKMSRFYNSSRFKQRKF